MPNLGSVLKAEITRLARKEVRAEGEATRKASSQHRRYIAALRRQVATLERQVAVLQRKPKPPVASSRPVRFTARGLRAHRERVGLSALLNCRRDHDGSKAALVHNRSSRGPPSPRVNARPASGRAPP
jgi:hypothetical protein